MALSTSTLISLGLAAGGAVAGGASTSTSSESRRLLPKPSDLESTLAGSTLGGLSEIERLGRLGEGPGDVGRGLADRRSALDRALAQAESTGGLPTAEDIAAGAGLSGALFQAERERQAQQFNDMQLLSARTAASLGRSGADPVLQAKLRVEQSRQAQELSARQGAAGTEIAMGLPGMRLGFGRERLGLATDVFQQALRNREFLLSQGRSIVDAERNYRLGVSGQSTNVSASPGLGGAIGGALAGYGAGQSLSRYGSGGGGLSTGFTGSPAGAGGVPYAPEYLQGLGTRATRGGYR